MVQRATATKNVIRRSFTELSKSLGTCIPGHLLAFDASTQLAQVQIGVRLVTAEGDQLIPAPIINCPVHVYGGGNYAIEVELNPGDEGLIVFSQRCIDAWRDTGGVANNPILRYHDMTDALFIPGFRSQPNAISGYSNNGTKIRNNDGSQFIWMKNDGSIEINSTSLTHNGVNIGDTHVHSQGPDSAGDTQQNTAGPQ